MRSFSERTRALLSALLCAAALNGADARRAHVRSQAAQYNVESRLESRRVPRKSDWAPAPMPAVVPPIRSSAGVNGTMYAASYRKDVYLPYSEYPEAHIPDPVDGGRLHVIGMSAATGTVSGCSVNGVFANMSTGIDPNTWQVDWIRVEPIALQAGAPFWLSFHSRLTYYDTSPNATVTCVTAAGDVAIDGSFPIYTSQVAITWVATSSGFSRILVHVHNNDSAPHGVSSLSLNGVDVTPYVANTTRVLPPKQSVMYSIPASAVFPGGISPGAVWTAQLSLIASPTKPAVAGGIFFREFFPIETWQRSMDCPFPTVNDWGYAQHRMHGLDTFFVSDGSASSDCKGPAGIDVLNQLAPQYGFYVLSDFTGTMNPSTVTNTTGLVGWFLSDEGDQNIDDNLRTVLANTVTLHTQMPSQPTYAGGSRNRYTGIFAGITDIKGLDFYIAACAPHVTDWGIAPPIRGSYDYLRNTRNNHMPGPTWTYSQGFEDGWDSFLGDRQPDPEEIAVSVMSVPASGAKGFMLFMSQLSYLNDSTAPSWATLGTLLREIGSMREIYRTGDITGMVSASHADGTPDTGVVSELVRSERALVLILINVDTNGGYSDLACGIGLPQHWVMVAHSIDVVNVTVPAGFCIQDSFEVSNATVVPGTILAPVCGPATFALSGVQLAAAVPQVTRTMVFAADTSLRGEIAQGLLPWNGPTLAP